MGKGVVRNTYPCDGCALRRVRCEGIQPCDQCTRRSLRCTFFRPRQKRGPKGVQAEPGRKIRKFQDAFESSMPDEIGVKVLASPESSEPTADSLKTCEVCSLQDFCSFLHIYQQQLYSIWPVVSSLHLIQKLKHDGTDYESYALAASLSAATIAQLRLPEHNSSSYLVDSRRFEQEAQRYRALFDYRECGKLASLLTSFFLHIYWANSEKLQTAGLYLREAITYAHRFSLHRPETFDKTNRQQHELQLRIYWMLFVSERTYCVQNGYHPILSAIQVYPCPDADEKPDSIAAYVALARVFTYLHEDILRCSGPTSHGQQPKLRQDIVSTMHQELSQDRDFEAKFNETQRIDIVVTRQWLRILLWHYAITNFRIYCNSSDTAFSSFLPVVVARDLLSNLSDPTLACIRAHGYGMELKVFKVADSLLDVLACSSRLVSTQPDLFHDSFESLQGLEKILLMVGGSRSVFLRLLRQRLAEVQPHSTSIATDLVCFSYASFAKEDELEDDCDDVSVYLT